MRLRYLCWTLVRLLGSLILLVGELVHCAGRKGQLRNESPRG